jgi:hypothetical protein
MDLADGQASVADYFEYYNHKRRHFSTGCLKPYHFHQQLLANITRFSPAQLDHLSYPTTARLPPWKRPAHYLYTYFNLDR